MVVRLSGVRMLGILGFMLYHLSHLHGHIASEAVIVELVNSKCLPTLLYGLEACPLKSADLQMFLLPADSADRVDVVYTETAIILPVCHS